MIFLDTSAIYALASKTDPNHSTATERLARILDSATPVVTHHYILVESFALLQHRLGLKSALAFERESHWFEIEWISREIHAEGARRWAAGNRAVSLVDHVSFVVMERRGIRLAFAFDPDFRNAGFDLYD